MRAVALLALVLVSASAETQVPDTDIFLAPLKRVGDSIVVGAAANVTHRAGYDNHPSFLPDGRSILYSAVGADGQADIWQYDIAGKRKKRLTSTPESEYSPAVMPEGTRFSVIRVERDSAQRIWSFALDGSDPRLVLTDLKPVSDYVWLDSARLLVHVLGTPSTLHIINRDGSGDVIRATDVGRALQRLPKGPGFTYTQRDTGEATWIMGQDIERLRSYHLVHAPEVNEFHAFLPDGTMLSASGARLLRWDGVAGNAGAWLLVADFASAGVRSITRLAVSRDGKWLAFSAEPAGASSTTGSVHEY
jgi:WD40 repeat protein